MITYDWNCKTVDVYPVDGGMSDVVYNVHWIVTGTSDKTDSEGVAYSSTAIGTQILDISDITDFIPFEDLTNEEVVAWTKLALDEEQVSSIEASIASQIEDKITPTSLTLTIEK